MLTIDHVDPQVSDHICGLDVEANRSLQSVSYNARKTNRFVPYRVCEHPAPTTFGDVGEFLIEGIWKTCEFGGPEWWEESNRIGNGAVKGAKKTVEEGLGIHSPELRATASDRGLKALEERKGVFSPVYLESEERKEALSKGGKKQVVEGTGIHSPEYKATNLDRGLKALEERTGIHDLKYRESEEYKEATSRGREKAGLFAKKSTSQAIEITRPDGQVFWFPSQVEASRQVPLSRATLYRLVKEEGRTTKGWSARLIPGANPFY